MNRLEVMTIEPGQVDQPRAIIVMPQAATAALYASIRAADGTSGKESLGSQIRKQGPE
jgi:hypothetical protein